MSQQVTFVTIGQLKGRTIALGPDKKYEFVNGEMKVDEDIAGLVARALQFYGAFPKGDAEQYHLAACNKIGIDPETLEPLGKEKPKEAVKKPEPAPEPVAEEEPEVEELSDRLQKIQAIVAGLDKDNPENWTGSGKPSLPVVKREFGGDVSRSEVDAVWNTDT